MVGSVRGTVELQSVDEVVHERPQWGFQRAKTGDIEKQKVLKAVVHFFDVSTRCEEQVPVREGQVDCDCLVVTSMEVEATSRCRRGSRSIDFEPPGPMVREDGAVLN